MIQYYVIESVNQPGSFWCREQKEFKGWLYATKYRAGVAENSTDLDDAIKEEPCKVVQVYDKE